ncbi:MAG: Asp23/Gls24 family envelope stress response protein [Oscillospiraceae bacterium]|nr:Asp23/Gls24 family envelope stress response protein [Oscillospiraceae bacterium]
MAENKQYITQNQENGCVMISEDVVATIVVNALTEIEGFAGLSTKPGTDIMDMIGKKNWGKGVKVTITEQDELIIDCNVLIGYGQSVVTVAQTIQSAVSAALESTTGANVLGVNVNVCGIVRK